MTSKSRYVGLIALAVCFAILPARADVKLPQIFSDHMVLQRRQPVVLHGTANPGEEITVTLDGPGRKSNSRRVTAAPDGAWLATLPEQEVGEPCHVGVQGKNNRVDLTDVLVGEVWFCSGQSNMALPLKMARDSEQEIAAANYPKMRLYSTPFATRADPTADVVAGKWQVCSPETAGSFSAVAYFFGRNLQKELNVPVGLIQSSVGGTSIESWLNAAALDDGPESAYLRAARDKQVALLPSANVETGWEAPGFADDGWKRMTVPGAWEVNGLDMKNFDGAVWFRREVTIPEDWAGKALTLNLGPIDDGDVTYFNGQKVGAMNVDTPMVWTTARQYPVPASSVKAGRAVIAVRITDQLGDGGFVGKPEDMWLGLADKPETRQSLSGDWAYQVAERWPAPGLPMGLYNGMVAPWTQFSIAGVIWYQGESNTNNPANYGRLLPKFIRGWRTAWRREELPFTLVQLPNYMKDGDQPGESQWASLREAQAVTAKDTPAVALAVTIDLGETGNIHPTNKQDVGYRIGQVVLGKFYGKVGTVSGPLCTSARTDGNTVRLRFTNVGRGLVVRGGELKGFAVAGADKKYVWARAEVAGDTVTVRADGIEAPVYLRYDWGNSPVCSLYNEDGFPAAPFRVEKDKVVPGG